MGGILFQFCIEHAGLAICIDDYDIAFYALTALACRMPAATDFIVHLAFRAVHHLTVFAELERVFLVFYIDDLYRVGVFAHENQLLAGFERLEVGLTCESFLWASLTGRQGECCGSQGSHHEGGCEQGF